MRGKTNRRSCTSVETFQFYICSLVENESNLSLVLVHIAPQLVKVGVDGREEGVRVLVLQLEQGPDLGAEEVVPRLETGVPSGRTGVLDEVLDFEGAEREEEGVEGILWDEAG